MLAAVQRREVRMGLKNKVYLPRHPKPGIHGVWEDGRESGIRILRLLLSNADKHPKEGHPPDDPLRKTHCALPLGTHPRLAARP